jgi:hypothetical protein
MRPGDVVRSRRRVRDFNERTGRFGLTLYVDMERELVNHDESLIRTDVDTIIRY